MAPHSCSALLLLAACVVASSAQELPGSEKVVEGFVYEGRCDEPGQYCVISRTSALNAQNQQLTSTDESLSFLSLGDWGCGDTNCLIPTIGWFLRKEYTDSGPTQSAVAAAMGKEADKIDSQFVLALGDNFYFHGVKSMSDPLFQSVWQDRFTAPGLQTPWYVILGNHDHYGNPQAQLDFSAAGIDPRWTIPNYYWSTVKSFGPKGAETKVQLVMIDTVILEEIHTRSLLQERIRDGFLPVESLALFDSRHTVRAGAREAQLEWLEDVLSTSTADWIIVCGHYPVFSGGEHGSTPELVNQVKPLLEKYKVAAYLSGHDHTAQHLASNGVNYYVVGNGCLKGTIKPLAETIYAAIISGFAAHEVTPKSLTTRFVNDKGATFYTHTITKP